MFLIIYIWVTKHLQHKQSIKIVVRAAWAVRLTLSGHIMGMASVFLYLPLSLLIILTGVGKLIDHTSK
jgi:uncharacterized membrane protein YjfL (UPF0719 family)